MKNPIGFPLSGAVTQSFNPWEFWIRSLSSQMGFINIRNVTSSDHRIEQEVVEDVASYGRQLGKINDVLTTILENPGLENLSTKEEQAILDFRRMVSQIEEVKKKWTSPTKLISALDTLVSEIKALKSEYPDIYEEAVDKVRVGLEILHITSDCESSQAHQADSLSACG